MPAQWYQERATAYQNALTHLRELRSSLVAEVGPANRPARLLAKAEKQLYDACVAFEELALRYEPGALIPIYLPGNGPRKPNPEPDDAH